MTNPSSVCSSSKFSRFKHRLRHDRGAVLVETAIALPLLLLVILGAFESGLAWEAKSATTSGVRTGVLRASTEANSPDADIRVIQSIIGEIGADKIGNLNSIAIFEVTGDADQDWRTCVGGTDPSAKCVVYDASFISQIATDTTTDRAALRAQLDDGLGAPSPSGLDYDCVSGKLDSGWCSGQRAFNGSDSTLGVSISYTHPWVTGIFPFDDPQFDEFVVSSTFINGGVGNP